MKYFLKNKEVDIVRVGDGSYDVTLFGTKKVNINLEELQKNFTLNKQADEVKEEMKKLARKIVDTRLMVDDDNAETLLDEAIGYANEIIRK